VSSVEVDCLCPNRPHEKDTITLRETLDFRSAMTLRKAVILLKEADPDADTADILAAMTDRYVVLGVESWTLVDEKRKPIEVTRAAIREHLLSNQMAATLVGDAADAQYGEVMLPLILTAFQSSADTPTEPSTSPTTGSEPEAPTPLRPSLTFTTQTDDTEATYASLAGVSS
jgi:hypothetical protein